MIRRLHEPDRAALLSLVSGEPEINLYLLGNLQTLGFERDFCEFFGDFDDKGRLRGCANRYMTGWSVYAETDADWEGLAALVDADPTAQRLQDNPGGIATLEPFLRRKRFASCSVEELMRLETGEFRPPAPREDVAIRCATLEDLPRLVDFYRDAGEMSRSAAGAERPLRDGRVFIAVNDVGQVVSAALTNAETSEMAMVGGVYTPPQWRARGYSQAVCGALCADLLADRKRPVLYWKTPEAGRIYHKLGFTAIGVWRSVWLEPRTE